MILFHDQRRQEPHHIVARGHGEHPMRAQLRDEVRIRDPEFETEHEPLSAQLLEDSGMFRDEAGKLLTRVIRDALDMRQEIGREHDVEHRIAHRHRQRIAAECRGMGTRRHAGGRSCCCKAGAHREAAADPLGDRHDVGRNPAPLMREQFARATDARLDFVEDEQHAALVAGAPERAQIFGRGRTQAAFALDGLDEQRPMRRGECRVERCQVAERHLIETIDLGAEALEIFCLPAGGDGGQCAAVEGAFEGDDAEALGRALRILIAARDLDRAFDRFDAGIREEDGIGEGRIDEPLRQSFLSGNAVKIGRVPELACLLGQRGNESGMGVAQRIDGDAGSEIEISLAILGEDIGSFAPDECDIRPTIGWQQRRKHGSSSVLADAQWIGGRALSVARRSGSSKRSQTLMRRYLPLLNAFLWTRRWGKRVPLVRFSSLDTIFCSKAGRRPRWAGRTNASSS